MSYATQEAKSATDDQYRRLLLPPEDEENLELHQSLTEIDEQELAVLAMDVAFTDTESAEH